MIKDKIVVVIGPTASGKSDLAVKIAEKYDGEVVSADSVSVYRGLDIGSAKPTADEMRKIKHHMIDVIDCNSEFSVSDYEKTALPIVYDIINRGKLPVICGGTGFYVNSLLYEMSYGTTGANLEIRKKYEDLASTSGKEFVWRELKKVDEKTAEKLHPNDLVRVIRALEIYYSTGVKKSDIADDLTPRFDFFPIEPYFDRETLYDRINKRVDEMQSRGLEAEVKKLMQSGITLDNQCMQGIGYKETYSAILNGENFPGEIIKQNSRRYAKRQITFFKKFNPYSYEKSDDTDKKLFKKLDIFLNIKK